MLPDENTVELVDSIAESGDFTTRSSPLYRTSNVTIKVDALDFLMGWGKTTLIFEMAWDILTGKNQTKLMIAFKTRKSILEFVWKLRSRILSKGRTHAKRYEERYTLLFDLDDADAKDIAKEFFSYSGDKDQFKYIKSIRASTSTDFTRNNKIRLVLTTHETAARTANVMTEYDAIFDEVPDWVMILKDRFSEADEDMLKNIGRTKSEDFAAARGLQKKLETGMFSEYEVDGDDKVYKKAWLFNGNIKWRSMCIFAAFPTLTDLYICAKAFPGKFQFDNFNPEEDRRATLALITWEKIGDANANYTLSSGRKQLALHKEMERTVAERNGLIVHFKKNHKSELPCITNGTTGSNYFRHMNVVGVAAIKFKKPWVSKLCGQFFSSESEQKDWEAKVSAAISLQSIFRSAIRDKKPITVCYIDDRTKDHITNILTAPGGTKFTLNQALGLEPIDTPEDEEL